MEYDGETLVVDRNPSELDEIVLEFTEILDAERIEYAIVSGYVAILTGRSRATEDIDIVTERLSEKRTRGLANRLQEAGYWGATMPLEELFETLDDDLRQRIAEEGTMIPNVELWFVKNDFERTVLEDPLVARIGGREIAISPIELQIAYKLFLTAEKDFEDALHLYQVFEGQLDEDRLRTYVTELEVTDAYDELRRT